MKFAFNGVYLAAPTTDGKIVVWNAASKSATAVIPTHPARSVIHSVSFHPTQPFLAVGGDDSTICIMGRAEE
jgi:WD40 repeat protein